MSFDIDEQEAGLAVEDVGAVVQILDANEDPAMYGGTSVTKDDGSTVIEGAQPVTWTVCGMNSKTYRKAEAWQRKELRMLGNRKQTADEAALMFCGFIARCSLGYTGMTSKGQPFPFSTDNATSILYRLPFIKRQVEAAMSNHAGFTKTPSAT